MAIYAFKQRNNLKCYKSHGEAGGADVAAVDRELLSIRSRLSHYCINNIFNADEFALFYNLTPTSTIGPARLLNRKKEKQRVTFLACCNGDGTEKQPPLVVGHSANPHWFKGQEIDGAGFEYVSTGKAWMNRDVFFEWFHRLDQHISSESGRRMELLVDNASCHGNSENLTLIHNAEVTFLPKILSPFSNA